MGKHGCQPRPLKDRFEEKFIRGTENECWEWQASVHGRGYGQIQIGDKKHPRMGTAPRVAYELYVGEISEGMHVCHTCDNKRCVNPAHLRLGTNAENHLAMAARGQGRQSTIGRSPGVYKMKDPTRKKPWVARLLRRSLGTFSTEEEAYEAVIEARQNLGSMVKV